MGGLRRVEVTQKDIEEIIRQRERTGVGFSALLRGPRGTKPDGLQSTTIRNWLKGRAKTALDGHTDWVIARYRALPDKPKATREKTKPALTPNPPLPDGFVEELNMWRDCGILPTYLLQNANGAPDGFNRSILANWLSRISSTGHADHVAFVRGFCEGCLDSPAAALPVTRPMRKALRELWGQFDEQKQLQLHPQAVKTIDQLLTDMSAKIHPKDWQKLISELKERD